jgi:hypothetical protein
MKAGKKFYSEADDLDKPAKGNEKDKGKMPKMMKKKPKKGKKK